MFDPFQLEVNQMNHIKSMQEQDWKCDVPQDVSSLLVTQQIWNIFLPLNSYGTPYLIFHSMKGPVDTIPSGQSYVSRPSKMRVDWFSRDFVSQYIEQLLGIIKRDQAALDKQDKEYIYHLGMWIPVYSAYKSKEEFRGGIMTHFGRKIIWAGDHDVVS